jgi:hypothetical protein
VTNMYRDDGASEREWSREARQFSSATINGQHTLSEYLTLYRQGRVGPLQYGYEGVAVVYCRQCGCSRADNGTACVFCGAYQRCTPDNPNTLELGMKPGGLESLRAEVAVITARSRSTRQRQQSRQSQKSTKSTTINPRRRNCNVR